MSMSKKDYDIVAAAIREEYQVAVELEGEFSTEASTIVSLAKVMAFRIGQAHPRFDTAAFVRAAVG